MKEEDIRKMRRLYAAGNISQEAVAKQFGIDQTAVSKIIRNKVWAHVT